MGHVNSLRLVRRQTKDTLHIACRVQNPDNLQGLRFVTIDDQVRIDQKETVPFVGKFLSEVADAGTLCQLEYCLIQRVENPVGSFDVVAM
jgi:hypothetical protein